MKTGDIKRLLGCFVAATAIGLVAALPLVGLGEGPSPLTPQLSTKAKLGGTLWLTLLKRQADGGYRSYFYAPRKNLIVDAGETALRDCFGGTGTPDCAATQNFKFHGIGTGATAAAEANTACQTELTTQYNPDNTRATGTQTNNGANIYRTVGTNTVDAAAAITEWCLMSNATVGSGTMWSRVVFSTINLANGDSLQTTYDLTIE